VTTKLRTGRSEDGPALTRLFLAARRDAMPDLPTDAETARWMETVVLETHDVTIAEVDGRVAGFAAVEGDLLGHLYVDPAHQRRGIGSALLDRVKELRPAGFRFWVFQQNEKARRFYEARDCRLVDLTDGSQNEEREPDALYEWLPLIRP
jgi:GNAT superfamily N-acetyltransferase